MSLSSFSSGQTTLDNARVNRMGYLKDEEVALIAADPATRLTLLLVRCGNGRFLAPAQDVAHFIGIIEEHARQAHLSPNGWMVSDYIRDVSLVLDGLRLLQ